MSLVLKLCVLFAGLVCGVRIRTFQMHKRKRGWPWWPNLQPVVLVSFHDAFPQPAVFTLHPFFIHSACQILPSTKTSALPSKRSKPLLVHHWCRKRTYLQRLCAAGLHRPCLQCPHIPRCAMLAQGECL